MNKQTIFELDSRHSSLNNKQLKIIHFNDVYNIEGQSNEPLGGAARFLTLLKQLKSSDPCLVLFSGDAFSPSSCNKNYYFYESFNLNSYYNITILLLVSTITKGQHMIDVLNSFEIKCACIGNHDFGEIFLNIFCTIFLYSK